MTTQKTSYILLTLTCLIGLSAYLVKTSSNDDVLIKDEGGVAAGFETELRAANATPDRIEWRPESSDEPGVGAATGPWGAKVGSHFVHAFQSEQRAEIEADGRGRQKLLYLASGRLGTRVVARQADELIAQFSFSDLRLQGQKDGNQVDRSYTELQTELEASRSLLRMRSDGTQLGLRFDKELSLEARQWIRGLVIGLQFVVQETGRPTWESEEGAMAGKYLVRYRWTKPASDEEAGQIVKQKLHMTQIYGLDEAQARTELGGQATATLGGTLHWIADSSTDENQEMSIPFFGTQAKAGRKLGFQLLGHGWDALSDQDRVSFEDAWQSIDGSAEAEKVARTNELLMMKARLGNMRLEDAAAALLAAVERNDRNATYEARQDLLWLVRLHPEQLGKLTAMIQSSRLSWAAALMAAIGGADTRASEAYLRDFVANRRLSDERRNAAVVSLFQSTAPGNKTLTAVREILGRRSMGDPLFDTSLLLLGKFSRGNEAGLQKLLAFEGRAQQEGRLELWLESLGNARSLAVLPTAKRYLEHGNSNVRNSAVHSLDSLRSSAVTALLARKIQTERSMIVRSSMAIALAKKGDPAAMAAIERLLLNEKSKDVRKSAIQGLGLQGSKRARWLLMRTANQDPSQELREMAAKILRS